MSVMSLTAGFSTLRVTARFTMSTRAVAPASVFTARAPAAKLGFAQSGFTGTRDVCVSGFMLSIARRVACETKPHVFLYEHELTCASPLVCRIIHDASCCGAQARGDDGEAWGFGGGGGWKESGVHT